MTSLFDRSLAAAALSCSLLLSGSVHADTPKSAPQAGAPQGASKETTAETVVATYDGKSINVGQIDAEIESKPAFAMYLNQNPDKKDQLRATVANTMINRTLLLDEAKRSGVVDEAEVQSSVEKVVKEYGGKEKLGELLKNARSSYDRFSADIADDFRLQEYIKKGIGPVKAPTEAEMKAHFEKHQQRYAPQPEVRARHILLKVQKGATPDDDKKIAEKIAQIRKEAVDQKVEFAELAKKHSQDGSAQQGGDLGWFKKGMMVPQFEASAFSLQPGQVSEAVRTQFGYHLIKVEERKEAGPPVFENAKEIVARELSDQQREQLVTQKLKELREKAKVEVKLPGASAS
jgi:parvulin-like peptidyl-prolyl isomerase